jgi:DNA-binding transcriptional ArsR family regulator
MQVVLDAIVEPNRRHILDTLRDGERDVGELVDTLAISQPSVSKHLRVLKDAGLVSVTPDAQRRVYRLSERPLRQLDEWLEPYRVEWHSRLDALEHHLDHMLDDMEDS